MTAPIGLKTAGPHVVLDGVNTHLLDLVAVLDKIHQQLFSMQLVITSAKDGSHAAGSLHEEGLAVDLRTNDKTLEQNILFLHVLAYVQVSMAITVFDERNLPGAPHLHIEWHGAA